MLNVEPLPFEPQPDADLKARFSAALTPHYDVTKVEKGLMPPPGLDRKHVFDFERRVRLIASVDYDSALGEDSARVLHLSLGLQPGYSESTASSFCDILDDALMLLFKSPPKVLRYFSTPRALHLMCAIPDEYAR